ncbi:cell surface spherulin 4-like protein [Phlyctema vagabunda]|uniref:Cell surface spherulin 4-like protein n=1 Tax=Phlyctema vagabunda TaxID=108571 RepID=A0ABR4PMY8_9HELO
MISSLLDDFRRSKFYTRKYLIIAGVAVAVLIIVISVAVSLGKKGGGSSPKSDVLVPLYVYPNPGAWDPLITAIEEHPDLHFTVVVNPENGPGAQGGPNANYTREIPKLNSYDNVRTVGYVSTNYSARSVDLVLQDIRTYTTWSDTAELNLTMHGIFLDEAPSQYEAARLQYYEQIASSIWSISGLGSDPLIIHNPGVIPDERYLAFCNLTIAFEGTYSTYKSNDQTKAISQFSASSKYGRKTFASIVHSVPTQLSTNKVKSFVKNLRSASGSVFVTGLSVDYYSTFWSGWQQFVSDMA